MEYNDFIDGLELKDKLGIDISDLRNKGYHGSFSRDNEMFGLIKKWHINNIVEVKIERIDDKYMWVEKDSKGRIEEGRLNTQKSFNTYLQDVTYLDSSLRGKTKIDRTGKKFLFDKFSNWFSTRAAVNSYKKMMSTDNINQKAILEYWKSFGLVSNQTSVFNDFKNKVIFAIYKYGKENGYIIDDEVISNKSNKCKLFNTMIISCLLNNNIIKTPEYETYHTPDKLVNADRCLAFSDEESNIFPITVKELISEISKGNISIPVFQREYVWKYDQIINLLNSMLMDFPIGSILLARTDLNFGTKNEIVSAIKSHSFASPEKKGHIIIDGQQRTTSLILFAMYHFLKVKADKTTNLGQLKTLIDILAEKVHVNNDEGKFMNSKDYREYLTNKEFKPAIIEDMIESSKLKNFKKPKDFVLLNKIMDYKISVIRICGLKVDRLIDVFEKINIGSRKLTNIDLLHAALYGQDQSFDLFDSMLHISNNKIAKSFEINNDLIIQVWTALYICRHGDTSKFDISNKEILKIGMNETTAKNFIKLANEVSEVIVKAITIAWKEWGFNKNKMCPNNSIILTLSVMVATGQQGNLTKMKELRKNIVRRTIRGDYSSSTRNKIEQDLKSVVSDDIEYKYRDSEIDWNTRVNEAFSELSYKKNSNPIYKLVVAFLQSKGPLGLTSGQPVVVEDNIFENKDINQHHFIPKKANGIFVNEDEINKIKNIVIISSGENKNEIKNKTPYKYLDSRKVNDETIKMIADSHLFNFEDIINIYKNDDGNHNVVYDALNNREDNIKKEFLNTWIN